MTSFGSEASRTETGHGWLALRRASQRGSDRDMTTHPGDEAAASKLTETVFPVSCLADCVQPSKGVWRLPVLVGSWRASLSQRTLYSNPLHDGCPGRASHIVSGAER